MLVAADVYTKVLFAAAENDVIQRVEGGVEMFSYGKPTRSVNFTTEVLDETFL